MSQVFSRIRALIIRWIAFHGFYSEAASATRRCTQTSITFNYFGTFVRAKGEPATITKSFSTANPNTAYVMTIATGARDRSRRDDLDRRRDDQDRERDDQDDHGWEGRNVAEIYLNGSRVVAPSAFNQKATAVKIPISVTSSNTISVRLLDARKAPF